jgi:hypothetical protein
VARGRGRAAPAQPVVDLAAPAPRTGPDAAAADADREENHDPEAATADLTGGGLDGGGAIREHPARCKKILSRQPPGFNLQRLIHGAIPIAWADQRAAFGF